MEKDSKDDTAKTDAVDNSTDGPARVQGSDKKRKYRDANDGEKEEEIAKKRQEDKRKENNEKGADDAKENGEEKEAFKDTKPSSEDDKAQTPSNEQQQQQAAAVAAALGNPLLAAGMPLSAVAGLDPSSPQASLSFLLGQQQQGQLAFGGGSAGLASLGNQTEQQRLLQGLVANRNLGNMQQQEQGQESGSFSEAFARNLAAANSAGMAFPGTTLGQLYAQQGVDPAQMMMMGMTPGLATGNPFMGGAARPLLGGAGRLADDANLASFASNLYRSPSIPLGLPCDDEHLSEYQILVRQQLELFEAEQEDVDSNTQGRKKAVVLGQVGLRCKHCAGLTLRQRGKGSVYYPTKLTGIYQAAQNMASSHLVDACPCIDERMKVQLMALRQRRDTASGGKQYWADGAKAVGLYESEGGLRLNRQPTPQPQAQQQQSL